MWERALGEIPKGERSSKKGPTEQIQNLQNKSKMNKSSSICSYTPAGRSKSKDPMTMVLNELSTDHKHSTDSD